MRRYATSLIGGLMGLAAGIVVTQPLAAVFSSTHVKWDATACSAGVYTITTTATGAGGAKYVVTSKNVRLPRREFTQEFDLPTGTFTISTVGVGNRGQTFTSTRTISNPAVLFGPPHRTSASQMATYGTRSQSTAVSSSGRAATLTPGAASQPKDLRSTAPTSVIAPATPGRAVASQLGRLIAILEQAADGDLERPWERIEAIDTDADGQADTFRIDYRNGETVVLRIT